MPSESPTIRTRSGWAAVGSLGLGGDRRRWRRHRAARRSGSAGVSASRGRGRPGARHGEPDRAAGLPVRPVPPSVTDTMCESCSARLSGGHGPDNVEADRAPGARPARPGRCAAGWERRAGTTRRRRRQRRALRQGPAPGRRRRARRRAGATEIGPAAPGATVRRAVSDVAPSEAVVDERGHADGPEGGDAEEGDAEQADLDRGPLPRRTAACRRSTRVSRARTGSRACPTTTTTSSGVTSGEGSPQP